MSLEPRQPQDELPVDEEGLDAPAAGDSGDRSYDFVVPADAEGQRVDVFLSTCVADVSRARIRRSIDAGLATIDGQSCRPSLRLAQGQRVSLTVAPVAAGPQGEPIPLAILYEDDAIAVVDKPPGMVVHPAKGHWSGTLAAGLVHRYAQLSGAGGVRPGIVHRLDRDTSGVIVVARTDEAHHRLAEQFHDRTVEKEYLAIVAGVPDWDAERVDLPIGPHPTHREKMALRPDHADSRPAETLFEVVERYRGFALVRARPKTGRTHQIRLHLAHLRYSVLCDKQYGSRSKITAGELRGITRVRDLAAGLDDSAVVLGRQALHAHRLSLSHPVTGERMSFAAPLAADLESLRLILRQSAPGR